MNPKKEFITIFKENIHREGADKLLEYLLSKNSDFFIAPASTVYHGSFDCGLSFHSVNVYNSLRDYLARGRCLSEYGMNYSDESIAIVALCHDLCKINCYKKYLKNQKDEITGIWEKVPAFKFEDPDPLGHGEKSMFLVSKFMKLTNEEAFAIRYHMGFSGTEDARNVGAAFEKYPLALALYVADMEASNYVDDQKQLEVEIDEEERQELKRRYPSISM